MTSETKTTNIELGNETEFSATTLIMTQNIGTLEATGNTVSEEIKKMTDDWIVGVADFVQGQQSGSDGSQHVDVFALHLQEVGGKKFNDAFNDYLCRNIAKCWPEAGWCSGLLMHRKEDQDTFTAMGTVLFTSKRLLSITSLLSVRQRVYVALEDKPELQPRDHLFHGAKFSNAEKSRKGYLLSSLRVGPRIMNFVNLHLYHDADNGVAISESPSVYVPRRREALLEAIVEVAPLLNPSDSLFLFGDFNLRLDGHNLFKFLEGKFGKVEMGKKEVKAPQAVFDWINGVDAYLDDLKQFDLEGVPAMEAIAQATGVELGEFARHFRPTYAYKVGEGKKAVSESGPASPVTTEGPTQEGGEGEESGEKETEGEKKKPSGPRPYAQARVPAWCDRVLFNPAALAAMSHESAFNAKSASVSKGKGREGCGSGASRYVYSCAEITEMDHQAVYLLADLRIL